MATVEHRGARIFFEDVGQGRCLVLGHSFLCSGEMWAPQVPVLSRSYRVLNPDLRGHGRSGPAEDAFTLYDLVDDVVAVLDQRGIERAVWVGLSIGGMVALRAALSMPDRVAALVLVDTHAGAERPWNRLQYQAMALVARRVGIRPLLPTISRRMFGRTTRRCKPDMVQEWRRRFAAVHVPSVLQGLEALLRRDSVVDRLGEIEVPALVMVGEEDVTLPVPYARQIAAGIPDATLVLLERCGHLAALERPEAVTEAMLEFVGRL